MRVKPWKRRERDREKNCYSFVQGRWKAEREKIWLVISFLVVFRRCVWMEQCVGTWVKMCCRFMSRLSSCHRKCSVRCRRQANHFLWPSTRHTQNHKKNSSDFSSFCRASLARSLSTICAATGEDLLAIFNIIVKKLEERVQKNILNERTRLFSHANHEAVVPDDEYGLENGQCQNGGGDSRVCCWFLLCVNHVRIDYGPNAPNDLVLICLW